MNFNNAFRLHSIVPFFKCGSGHMIPAPGAIQYQTTIEAAKVAAGDLMILDQYGNSEWQQVMIIPPLREISSIEIMLPEDS